VSHSDVRWVLALSLGLTAFGCGDEKVEQSGRGVSGGSASAAKPAPPAAPKIDTLVFKDDDFVESERHRDPFHAFTVPKNQGKNPEVVLDQQRPVIMPETPVESMKLIAVISGLTRPKAMLTDTHGVGYVVQRGDYIGTAKVFQTTGSVAITMNWRVDRIRENEVVLTRQDPSDPGRPPLSRIISMREEIATR
jgi:Tfp pilus assembly protein PilP